MINDMSMIGSAVIRRIAFKERAKAQVEFFQLLGESVLRDWFVLSGSAAMHTLHLRGRFCADIDFLSNYDHYMTFLENPNSFGLPINNVTVSDGSQLPAFIYPGTVYRQIALTIDVTVKDLSKIYVEQVHMNDSASNPCSIRAQSLWQLLAEKLNCVCHRVRAVDFYDLWLGLKTYPELKHVIQREVKDYSSTYRYQAEIALYNLGGVESTWVADLLPSVISIPEYSLVQRDLKAWLPVFNS